MQGTQITVESFFIGRFTMNNTALKLQKCWTHKIAFKIISKKLKQPNFIHSQLSTLPKVALAKFYLSTTFGLSFMISSVAPTRSPTCYAYLITKIGNCNLNKNKISEQSTQITQSFWQMGKLFTRQTAIKAKKPVLLIGKVQQNQYW